MFLSHHKPQTLSQSVALVSTCHVANIALRNKLYIIIILKCFNSSWACFIIHELVPFVFFFFFGDTTHALPSCHFHPFSYEPLGL